MNEQKKAPGEAPGGAGAAHGYRNEVSWEGGTGRQPYANRGDPEQAPDAMPEPEAGNAGEAAGRNVEDLEAVKEKPGGGRAAESAQHLLTGLAAGLRVR